MVLTLHITEHLTIISWISYFLFTAVFRFISCGDEVFSRIAGKFTSAWQKGVPPIVHQIFEVKNESQERKWRTYRQRLSDKTIEEHFHGTKLSCNIAAIQAPCSDGNCGICGISCSGLDRTCIRKNIDFQRFGQGFYLAPHSSKCHDYTEGAHSYRAMLLCDVCPGKKYRLETNSQHRRGPPPGYDSVYGQVGSKLNYPEIVVYEPDAVIPRFIILYQKDGVAHPLSSWTTLLSMTGHMQDWKGNRTTIVTVCWFLCLNKTDCFCIPL